ncbi:hypothetical protein KIN20_024475 [Parelaphostrongylus tenuis]|uniref:Uncharacterized protein n=1 Tax=Parelaphostrongylus tenuis TaxID=148309 RepID=A0AAD5N7M2_PARTN|nr:hypothetical protein KIN20_024475 [Parelaphostrongylus tenuis]
MPNLSSPSACESPTHRLLIKLVKKQVHASWSRNKPYFTNQAGEETGTESPTEQADRKHYMIWKMTTFTVSGQKMCNSVVLLSKQRTHIAEITMDLRHLQQRRWTLEKMRGLNILAALI